MEDSVTFNKLMPRCCSRERAAGLLQKCHSDPADLHQTEALFTAHLSSSLLTHGQEPGAMLKIVLMGVLIGILELQTKETVWANHRTGSL